MNKIIYFFKNILFMNDSNVNSIGLSQFKVEAVVNTPKLDKPIKNKEIKLSDLMRRA